MKLLFKQRVFSWLDSFDIYAEDETVLYTVKGQFDFGHHLNIYDREQTHVGTVKQEIFRLLPRFNFYIQDELCGTIKKELTFLNPVYTLDYKNWTIEGDIFAWEYTISDGNKEIATLSKQIFNFSDTYVIDVVDPNNHLTVLMVTLAIDAARCSS